MCWWGDGVAGVDKPNVLVGRWGKQRRGINEK